MNKRPFSFETLALAVLASVMLVATLVFVLGDRSGARSYQDCPHYVRVRRRSFENYQQKLENERLGQTYSPLYLDFDKEGSVCLGYGDQYTWSHTSTIQTTNHDVRYKLAPPKEKGTWTMQLSMPRPHNFLHPQGLYAVYLHEADGTWSDSEWVLFEEDGTGYCGWGGFNAITASRETARKHGKPCTWHVTPLEHGCIVVLDYEGGQSTIVVTN